MLKQGQNCWRINKAEKVRLLIDGEAYFSHFRQAVIQAKRRILISGWDIDSHMDLVRSDKDDGYPHQLGEFFLGVLKKNKRLHIYMLIWDFSMLFAFERDWSPVFKHADWRRHRRLHLIMDNSHPTGGSHHQKIVTIDDSVAFVGGFDLSKWRWDTPAHDPDDQRLVDPSGKSYKPFHDLQLMLSGAVVRDLNDLFAHRWKIAAGKTLPSLSFNRSMVFKPVESNYNFHQVNVGIARTYYDPEENNTIRETEKFHIDAIRKASKFIYIENQYLSSSVIGNEIIKRLKVAECPEIVIVLPMKTGGWLEQLTMDVLRDRLLYLFKLADKHSRLRIFYPRIEQHDNQYLSVHSKLLIADDQILKVGSSNLSNRSMSVDSECDIIIAANDDQEITSEIRTLRHQLLSEHLGITRQKFSQAEKEIGKLIPAIESVNAGKRRLCPLEPKTDEERIRDISAMTIVDPEKPIEPDKLVEHFIGSGNGKERKNNLKKFLFLLITLAVIAIIWSVTPVGDWLSKEKIAGWFHIADQPSWKNIYYITVMSFLGALGFPITILIGSAGILFGPIWGLVLAMGGSLGSALLSYMAGHFGGKKFIREFAGKKINVISKRLSKRGIWTIIIVRIVPVAPFAIINMLAGASHIRLKDYTLGTIIGMLPGVLLLTTFFGQLINVIREASADNFLIMIGLSVLVMILIFILIKYFYHKKS